MFYIQKVIEETLSKRQHLRLHIRSLGLVMKYLPGAQRYYLDFIDLESKLSIGIAWGKTEMESNPNFLRPQIEIALYKLDREVDKYYEKTK